MKAGNQNMKKGGYVYITASKQNGTIYIGVTINLVRRIYEHRTHKLEGFTKKYNVTKLVWYEKHDTIESAILREKQMKKWKRDWKLKLIESLNPEWNDLYEEI